MILFLSKYPQTDKEFRDGFFQRVVNIDSFYKEDKRVYLDVQLFRNFKKKTIDSGKDRIEYSCNLFLHLFFIISIYKKSNLVYIQSLHNALYNFLFIKFIDNKYVLDLHGVVPEELSLQGLNMKSKLFALIETIIFAKLDICIAVTNRLAKHYCLKYPKAKAKYITYAILPNNLESIGTIETDSKIVNVIYSGNTQAWQNVDLMLKTISQNISDNIHYTILTGELDIMKSLLVKSKLDNLVSINVLSVQPSQLSEYYQKANYGFILRDDITVNNVACPTKLVEYLTYGIIPIVLSDKIGDFKELGYEYISVQDFSVDLPILKSKINQKLVENFRIINSLNLKDRIYYLLNQ